MQGNLSRISTVSIIPHNSINAINSQVSSARALNDTPQFTVNTPSLNRSIRANYVGPSTICR